jgi:hypothetical protein
MEVYSSETSIPSTRLYGVILTWILTAVMTWKSRQKRCLWSGRWEYLEVKSAVFWGVTRRRVVIGYHTTPRNTPEDRRFNQHRGRSLKSRIFGGSWKWVEIGENYTMSSFVNSRSSPITVRHKKNRRKDNVQRNIKTNRMWCWIGCSRLRVREVSAGLV